jgi:hypothetical protein
MTTVLQPQADEIQIIRTPATIADAQLIVQMARNDAVSGADRGFDVLNRFDTPPTLGQLRKKYPMDSEGYHQVMAFLGSCETTATFVKHRLLNLDLANDLYWIEGAWRAAEKVCKGLRRENGEPRSYENFEWLVAQTR